ncbi:MAG: hypothetical protein ACI8T1_001800 [Verrucomicrobiales bacterium]|jgi:hypothetical protein
MRLRILIEGRYRIKNIRGRTRIRSKVLEALLVEFRGKGIILAQPPMALSAGG